MTITLGIDSVCYQHTMKSKKLDLQGFLDKAVANRAGAVQMDPSWPSQGMDLGPKSLSYLRHILDERGLTDRGQREFWRTWLSCESTRCLCWRYRNLSRQN